MNDDFDENIIDLQSSADLEDIESSEEEFSSESDFDVKDSSSSEDLETVASYQELLVTLDPIDYNESLDNIGLLGLTLIIIILGLGLAFAFRE